MVRIVSIWEKVGYRATNQPARLSFAGEQLFHVFAIVYRNYLQS
jgi:hypothetical protein